jgi:hypothetical protein
MAAIPTSSFSIQAFTKPFTPVPGAEETIILITAGFIAGTNDAGEDFRKFARSWVDENIFADLLEKRTILIRGEEGLSVRMLFILADLIFNTIESDRIGSLCMYVPDAESYVFLQSLSIGYDQRMGDMYPDPEQDPECTAIDIATLE